MNLQYICFLCITTLILYSNMAFSQSERKNIRQGNRDFEKENFEEAEVDYRKALEKDPQSFEATFNLGDALFRQEKYEDASKEFTVSGLKNTNKENVAKAYHNLGNSLLQAGKLPESIEAYKQALRNNPKDMETKYNLAYAQNMMQNQQQDQDQENKDEQENKDQQQDQNKQDKKDQQQQNNEEQKQKQQQEQKENISKEDAERILKALENDEKELQEKLQKQKKEKSKRYRIEKDW